MVPDIRILRAGRKTGKKRLESEKPGLGLRPGKTRPPRGEPDKPGKGRGR